MPPSDTTRREVADAVCADVGAEHLGPDCIYAPTLWPSDYEAADADERYARNVAIRLALDEDDRIVRNPRPYMSEAPDTWRVRDDDQDAEGR